MMADTKYVPMLTVKEKTVTEPAEFIELCTGPCEDSVTLDVTGTTDVPVTGSLTISEGSIAVDFGAELDALSKFNQTGLIARTGVGSYSARTITASTGISVTNGNGVASNPTIGLGTVPINKLASYPSSSSRFLRGDGSWQIPIFNITLPYNLYTSAINNNSFKIHNSNSSATATGFTVVNQNTSRGVEFGMNNSTNEGYVFCDSTVALKFGTNGTSRLSISAAGVFNFYSNRLTSTYTASSSYDLTNKLYVDNKVATAGGGIQDSATISVNTKASGVIYPDNNYLRRSYTTLTNVQIYGLGTSSNSFMLENRNGESAGIAFNGGNDCATIWTAGDSGSYLNIQDEDSSNSRLAYVNTSGSWIVVSSKQNKHSICDKANNNVLDRFLNLSVKSYGLTYDKKNKRTEKKSNKMNIGFVLEDLFEVFPNCIDGYYNKLGNKKSNKNLKLEDEVEDVKNSGVNYNNVLCYLTIAFQEYVTKTNNEIDNLKKEINYVKNK